MCKHVNYFGGVGVCEDIDIFLGIYLNHTLFICSAKIYLELIC